MNIQEKIESIEAKIKVYGDVHYVDWNYVGGGESQLIQNEEAEDDVKWLISQVKTLLLHNKKLFSQLQSENLEKESTIKQLTVFQNLTYEQLTILLSNESFEKLTLFEMFEKDLENFYSEK